MQIPDLDQPDPRLRLIAGLAAAVSARGYPASTIADIVRYARVSKRTFYEHFADKEACFLAGYRLGGELALAAVTSAVDPEAPWRERVRAAVAAYLRLLQAHPTLTRGLFLAVFAAGPHALRLRREMLLRFADLIRDLVRAGRDADPEVTELGADMAMALVGGINELVLIAAEEGRTDQLEELAGATAALVVAVLRGDPVPDSA